MIAVFQSNGLVIVRAFMREIAHTVTAQVVAPTGGVDSGGFTVLIAMHLNDTQRSIAFGAAIAALLAQFATLEQKVAERAALALGILVVALLLIIAFSTPTEDHVAVRTLPLPEPEPERTPIGFLQPA